MQTLCKKSILALFCVFVLISLVFGQANETIVITTYYPSPTHAFNTLEVKERLAIGDDSESRITDLNPGQLYVGYSILLGNTTTPSASAEPGEIIYNSNINKLQFRNETGGWVNASAG
jgi:hypothetical protein